LGERCSGIAKGVVFLIGVFQVRTNKADKPTQFLASSPQGMDGLANVFWLTDIPECLLDLFARY
jgi:hypothetical protein